jgi:hypothetical protein
MNEGNDYIYIIKLNRFEWNDLGNSQNLRRAGALKDTNLHTSLTSGHFHASAALST